MERLPWVSGNGVKVRFVVASAAGEVKAKPGGPGLDSRFRPLRGFFPVAAWGKEPCADYLHIFVVSNEKAQ